MSMVQPYIDDGRFEIVVEANAYEGGAEHPLKLTEDWLLAFPEMNAIIAQHDYAIMQSVQALIASGRDDVITVGADAEPNAVDAILDGNLTATVLLEPYKWGTCLIESVYKMMNGETVEKFQVITPIEINASNAANVTNFRYVE